MSTTRPLDELSMLFWKDLTELFSRTAKQEPERYLSLENTSKTEN
jgi:hypothetical protein